MASGAMDPSTKPDGDGSNVVLGVTPTPAPRPTAPPPTTPSGRTIASDIKSPAAKRPPVRSEAPPVSAPADVARRVVKGFYELNNIWMHADMWLNRLSETIGLNADVTKGLNKWVDQLEGVSVNTNDEVHRMKLVIGKNDCEFKGVVQQHIGELKDSTMECIAKTLQEIDGTRRDMRDDFLMLDGEFTKLKQDVHELTRVLKTVAGDGRPAGSQTVVGGDGHIALGDVAAVESVVEQLNVAHQTLANELRRHRRTFEQVAKLQGEVQSMSRTMAKLNSLVEAGRYFVWTQFSASEHAALTASPGMSQAGAWQGEAGQGDQQLSFGNTAGDFIWGKERLFDDRTATMDVPKYDPHEREIRSIAVRNYATGRVPDARVALAWAEEHRHNRISLDGVRSQDGLARLEVDAVDLSSQIWSWLHLSLQGQDSVMAMYENIEPLIGLEVWRQFIVQIHQQPPEQRARLHHLVMNPAKANTVGDMVECIEGWENNIRKCTEAGARTLDDEDMRITTMSMLPGDLPLTFIPCMRHIERHDDFKERIRVEAEYYVHGANKLNTVKGLMLADAEGDLGDVHVAFDDETESLLQMVPDAMQDQMTALFKKNGFRPTLRFRPGGARQPGARGDRPRGAYIPPRDKHDHICRNCGEEGHGSNDCKTSYKPPSERLLRLRQARPRGSEVPKQD